jgi:hypothetical protein
MRAACSAAADSIRVGELREEVDDLVVQREALGPEVVTALPADQRQRHLPVGLLEDEAARRLDDVAVEAAAQPLVRRHHDEQRRRPGVPGGEQWVRRRLDA